MRPGFLSVDQVESIQPNSVVFTNTGVLFFPKVARTNYFTIDMGAVLELYPSKRPVLRFEVGDTLMRHPAFHEFAFAKIGKRFERWGAFGKVRPGFVGFSKVNKLLSERAVLNN
ncbi:MAG TPA: hypothetical protein VLB46_09920 [Pyrinomonadaceae bacterium]|nr:hypothetical protein [Pyrinomonadaceae bacterium]